MKLWQAIVIIFLCLAALLVSGLEVAAGNHHDNLLPAVSQREVGRILEFKTIEYEPNSGNAKAYVVVGYWRAHRDTHSGKLYSLTAAPASEKWVVSGVRTVWDQARGDKEPFMTPYWAL